MNLRSKTYMKTRLGEHSNTGGKIRQLGETTSNFKLVKLLKLGLQGENSELKNSNNQGNQKRHFC